MTLHIAGIGMLFVSGILIASTILFPTGGIGPWWIDTTYMNMAVAFFGAVIALLLMNATRRERITIGLFEWLGELDTLINDLTFPLTVDELRPTGAKTAEIIPDNVGWVMLVKAPGLLIRGEMMLRKYLPVVVIARDSEWNAGWVESFLKNTIEGDHESNGHTAVIGGENGGDQIVIYAVSQNLTGDIAAGMGVVSPQTEVKVDPLAISAFKLGLDMIVQRTGSILMEVVQRRKGLGVEGLGLVMRILAHELNNDLQGAVNTMDGYEGLWSEIHPASVMNMRRLLTRSAHWTNLMREAPFLADEILPFERKAVCLSEMLRETLDEVQRAWPDVYFVVEAEEEIYVVGDHHLRSILRNLLHNAASFTDEQGKIEIKVEPDDETINLLVIDEGPGVDQADVDKIFAPLSSMKEGRTTGPRVTYGMGVGLTISRAIARAYGGELLCHSNQEGKGGVFEVVLQTADQAAVRGGSDVSS
ncbi:MAG: HAMP domain-containing sensor histidine kinase [Desulfomonilia bacterium]|nr:HAMP domain-containing sensor histidine kinase [Desulfomonilia bacterium]